MSWACFWFLPLLLLPVRQSNQFKRIGIGNDRAAWHLELISSTGWGRKPLNTCWPREKLQLELTRKARSIAFILYSVSLYSDYLSYILPRVPCHSPMRRSLGIQFLIDLCTNKKAKATEFWRPHGQLVVPLRPVAQLRRDVLCPNYARFMFIFKFTNRSPVAHPCQFHSLHSNWRRVIEVTPNAENWVYR